MELHMEVHKPIHNNHPFFNKYFTNNNAICRKICHHAIIEQTLARQDILFSPNETCDRFFFVKHGAIRYSQSDMHSFVYVQGSEWMSEAVLWTPWVHCGWAHASTGCTLLAVLAGKFHDTVRKIRSQVIQPKRYAEFYVKYLNS